ncbi:hypothetical protein GPJ56_005355 [Histomonas meleagridis]|uniref:uncharacterized protein n=1 Tax=Histomonas meleagridis TaxID=135588 RepID=UPI00355A2B57|nr:hypothetical protein GPJ56_005355 [Histomonas meleagridis]KAH0796335.1 hypothetical protein GO595_010228 [Histomonas meleagridis]
MCSLITPNSQFINLSSTITGISCLNDIPYISCSDGSLYTLIGNNAQLVTRLSASINCITTIQRTKDDKETFIVLGCSDSVIRLYNKDDQNVSSITLDSSATAISSYDFDHDGFTELLISLEDCSIVLISLALLDAPKIVSTIQIGFNISNIGIGLIYSSDMISALITSQTGQVGILFIEPKSDKSLLSGKAPKVTESEISQLKSRIEQLEIEAKKNHIQLVTYSGKTNVEVRNDLNNQKFNFLIESQNPISKVSISSTISLTYYPRNDSQIVIIPCQSYKSEQFSTVIQPSNGSLTRIAFDFSYKIGKSGTLNCFIMFSNSHYMENKSFILKPFGLFKKVNNDVINNIENNDLCVLEINGINSTTILENCFSVPIEEDEIQTFEYGTIGSNVTINICGDKFIAKSVFLSIINLLRNYIIKEMNKLKQKVSFETKIGENCINKFFETLGKKFINVMKDAALYFKLKALKEVRNTSPTAKFGSEEAEQIILDAAIIEKKFDDCKNDYYAYIDEIKIFYLEMWKAINIDATKKTEMLLSIIKNVKDEDSLKELIEFMKTIPK